MLYSQIDYNAHLVSQLKTKNKQITFLEDKIILMQKEKQSKIQEIQLKYHQKYKKMKCFNSTLQEQNCVLRDKLESCKSKISSFSQQYKKSFQESKELLELKYMNEQQVKKIKAKLQKQKKNNYKLEQQNLQLKTVLTMNEKTIKELNAKIIKITQQKNVLLSTYGDYDQIKHDLDQISKIYQDQYQGELQLAKNRLRGEMEENAKHIISELSSNFDYPNNSSTKMLRRIKSTQCLINNNLNQYERTNQIRINDLKQNNQNFSLNLAKTIQNSNPIKKQFMHDSNNKHNPAESIYNTWQSDMINLKNYVDYGIQYLGSFKGQNLYYQESQQIYKFIQKSIKQKVQAVRQKDEITQKLTQMKEQMEERMIFIEETMKEIKLKDVDKINTYVQTIQTQMPILRVSDLNIMLKNKIRECGQVIQYLTGIYMVQSLILLNNNYKIEKYYKPLINKIYKIHKQKEQKNVFKAKNRLKSIFLSVFFVQHLKKKAKKTKRLQKIKMNTIQIQKLPIKDSKICRLVHKCLCQYQRSKLQKSFQDEQNCQISKYISSTSTLTVGLSDIFQRKSSIRNLISRFLNQQTLAILSKQKLQFSYKF